MTRSTVRKLTKPLDEPEREFQRLRRAAWRLHQNKSLGIVRRNLFDDDASSFKNPQTKPTTPLKTLQEHFLPNSSIFQNPIVLPSEQTERIVNSRDILLFQGTCTFQGLRSEDPLRHIKHYLSIVDNIQADGATRDISRLRFFHFSLKGKVAEWLDKMPPPKSRHGISSYHDFLIISFQQDAPRSHEVEECSQNSLAEQVCLSRGDIYDDPSLLRFYQNDDILPCGNMKRKEKGEDRPEWVVRSKFEDELANFMLEKKFHAKGIG
ncbi:hypothetical protein Tco_1011638 [Tanacetum coccineum]